MLFSEVTGDILERLQNHSILEIVGNTLKGNTLKRVSVV
jgi:hypothetical protein